MDKKILAILVGTLCFGGGVGAGIGMMTLGGIVNKDVTTEVLETSQSSEEQDSQATSSNEEEQVDQEDEQTEETEKTEQQEVDKIEEDEKEVQTEVSDKNKDKEEVADLPEGISPWVENKAYAIGDEVGYEDKLYVCIQNHTSLVDWEPANVPALWEIKK